MNKSEFIRAYADKLGKTIKETELIFDTFQSTLTQCLKNGEYVHISHFCTFRVKNKKGRQVISPNDGQLVTIPDSLNPSCRFAKSYKKIFNETTK